METTRDRLDRALGAASVAWLQIVGIVTDTILHHVLHAIPLAVLVCLPSTPCVRVTRVLAALVWIVMLSLFSDNLSRSAALFGRGYFGIEAWLAPVMALLCAAWAAVCSARAFAPAFVAVLALAAIMTIAGPWLTPWLAYPARRTVRGDLRWLPLLVLEAAATIALAALLARALIGSVDRPLNRRVVIAQAVYWASFVALMIAGLMCD